jgi:hypothetical protein
VSRCAKGRPCHDGPAHRARTNLLFPNARGHRLSRDGVEYLLAKHVAVASQQCPCLRAKRVSPHVLRHSAGTPWDDSRVAGTRPWRSRRSLGVADCVLRSLRPALLLGERCLRASHALTQEPLRGFWYTARCKCGFDSAPGPIKSPLRCALTAKMALDARAARVPPRP